MNKWKIVGVVFLALLMSVCVGIDAWYIYLKRHAPVKTAAVTFELGRQTTTNGDSKYFIEVNYYMNKNKTGLEMFEIKYNYMLDERQDHFYQQGVQYLANTVNDSLNFNYEVLQTGKMKIKIMQSAHLNVNGAYFFDKTKASKYFYESMNDFDSVFGSTNPVNTASKFKIQIGEELYQLEFNNNGKDYLYDEVLSGVGSIYYHYYASCNEDYFVSKLFEAVKSVKPGTSEVFAFEFGDLFKYSKFDTNTMTYVEMRNEETALVKNNIKNYYSILVNVHENGAQVASDSMFNAIKGAATYNNTDNYESRDYFVGKNTIEVGVFDFDYILVNDNCYAAVLKQEFLNFYSSYNPMLKIVIDLDVLDSYGMNFVGFASNNSFGDMQVVSAHTQRTVNGNKVTEVLNYA